MARYNGVKAVVLGLETNGLSVVRSLGRARVMVLGVDSDLEQTTALSKYLLARLKTPDIRGEAVIDTLLRLGAGGQPYALFPTMDSTVLLLSEARDRLPENLIYRLPEKEMVRSLIHKGSFRTLCKTHDLESPGYAVVHGPEELEDALGKIRLPVVMKTTLKKMGPAPKAAVVEDRNRAMAFYREMGGGEVILEEWIPGGDREVYFCLQAFDARSRLLASFLGRKIRQWPPLVGGTASCEPADVPGLEEQTTRFFQQVKFQGLCSMEYKHDARNGRYYAIEPTVGRTDFQSGIAPANGVNIPLAAFAEMAGVTVKTRQRRRGVRWVHTVGDFRSAHHYMARGELTKSEWKQSLAGPLVSSLFALDDPGPWVSDLFRRAVGRLKRLFKRKGATP